MRVIDILIMIIYIGISILVLSLLVAYIIQSVIRYKLLRDYDEEN